MKALSCGQAFQAVSLLHFQKCGSPYICCSHSSPFTKTASPSEQGFRISMALYMTCANMQCCLE